MLLFLDIDGPLIPFGAPEAHAYPVYETAHAPSTPSNPLLTRIDPALGPRLAALGCQLVWATTWMDDANTTVAPWLGLPPLPVVQWPDEDEPPALLHWKTRPLVEWAGERPFIWVDDEITEADRAWVAIHHHEPALLHRVAHEFGLTDTDFVAMETWLRDLA
ncbi:HAD domain-containing protein [Streptomyces sp. NPDC048417]|uniref:HAD domain-containing protein n=1 Tax=Streptomyces sp. NPDC048417 TaxID=3155387 RepID=UPI0034459E3E